MSAHSLTSAVGIGSRSDDLVLTFSSVPYVRLNVK